MKVYYLLRLRGKISSNAPDPIQVVMIRGSGRGTDHYTLDRVGGITKNIACTYVDTCVVDLQTTENPHTPLKAEIPIIIYDSELKPVSSGWSVCYKERKKEEEEERKKEERKKERRKKKKVQVGLNILQHTAKVDGSHKLCPCLPELVFEPKGIT